LRTSLHLEAFRAKRRQFNQFERLDALVIAPAQVPELRLTWDTMVKERDKFLDRVQEEILTPV
jgi:hypothetical protein